MNSARFARLALPGYLIGILMVLVPIVDILAISTPVEPGDVQWRFGFLGLITRVLETPLLGFVVLTVVAGALDQRRMLRVFAVFAFIASLVALTSTALFSLDALQVRTQFNPQFQVPFDRVWVVGLLKLAVSILVLGAFGVTSWILSRPSQVAKQGDRSAELIVGS